MKFFKKLDLIIQAFLLVSGIIFCLTASGPRFIYPYYVVGGWQLFSFMIHGLIQKNWTIHYERREYGRIIFWLILIGIICFLLGLIGMAPVFMVYLLALLIISPFLAFWYLWISWLELSLVIRRELVHLK